MNAQYALFKKAKIEGFLVLLRGVAGFSNLRGLIVTNRLSISLSVRFPETPNYSGVAKAPSDPPLTTALRPCRALQC